MQTAQHHPVQTAQQRTQHHDEAQSILGSSGKDVVEAAQWGLAKVAEDGLDGVVGWDVADVETVGKCKYAQDLDAMCSVHFQCVINFL